MTTEVRLPLQLRGGNLALYNARDPEVLAEGPAGTGKTRTALELLNDLCHTYKGLRVLMARKTQASMPTSCIAEFKKHVLHPGDGVYFYGGSKDEAAAFRYPEGSSITVGGIDNPEKILSSFYDVIYVNEATELNEDDWETLTTRLRGSVEEQSPTHKDTGAPFVFRRIIADCNPTYASHWLMRRTDSGVTRLIRSRIEDNPAYFNVDGSPTAEGEQYMQRLQKLTGIRRERFLLGRRVGVENAIYPVFDRTVHIRPIEPGCYFQTNIIGVDYGTDHLCAVVALSIDQYRRRWVREVWAEADKDEGQTLSRIIGQFKDKYHTHRGRVDPNQAFLAGRVGFNVAKGGNGGASGPPRLHRIDLMEPLFYWYEGGRVPTIDQELSLSAPRGPFAEPDSPGLLLVEGAPGIAELADEIEQYHYVWTDTPLGKTKHVYRVNENRIASVEYANEEYEEGDARDFEATPRSSAPSFETASRSSGVRTGT